MKNTTNPPFQAKFFLPILLCFIAGNLPAPVHAANDKGSQDSKAQFAQMQKTIVQLRNEINALKKENAALKAKLKTGEPEKEKPAIPTKLQTKGVPSIGCLAQSPHFQPFWGGGKVLREDSMNLPTILKKKGVFVASVFPGGPAAKSGIKRMDIIYSIGNKTLKNNDSLKDAVAKLPVEKSTEVVIYRYEKNGLGEEKDGLGRVRCVQLWKWKKHTLTVTPSPYASLLSSGHCPIEIVSGKIYPNHGVPRAGINTFNRSTKTVVAYRIEIATLDRFDRPVLHALSKKPTLVDIVQETHTSFTMHYSLLEQLFYREKTGKVALKILEVKFKDGTTWKRPKDYPYSDVVGTGK